MSIKREILAPPALWPNRCRIAIHESSGLPHGACFFVNNRKQDASHGRNPAETRSADATTPAADQICAGVERLTLSLPLACATGLND